MTSNAPLFLICTERSGSNLMSTIMGAHPDIFAHPPHHLGRDLIMNIHRTLGDSGGDEVLPILRAHARGKVENFLGGGAVARFDAWFADRSTLPPVETARFIWMELPDGIEGKRVFIKENNIHRMLPFLITAFPDAKFVFQVRDPRDFLVSALKRRKGPLGNKFGSVREAVNVWREDNLAGLNALALLGPEKVHLVRYEDLIRDPDTILRGICQFEPSRVYRRVKLSKDEPYGEEKVTPEVHG